VLCIPNRSEAIDRSVRSAAGPVLIAGKGHETYQETNGERIDFDDFKIVKSLLKEMNK
jgi:UDP-N-acetylmuramoyl-L-alanyl-D-glutamate--2,6-diaminopimelate ligase